MALAKEILGIPLMEKFAFVNNSFNVVLINQKQGQFALCPAQVKTTERRSLQIKKAGRTGTSKSVVAAISEQNLIKVVPEKPVEFKVRAVVTVRNKHKEDLKESIVKQLDALTDKIGRNVVLELVSTEVDPSKPFFSSFFDLI